MLKEKKKENPALVALIFFFLTGILSSVSSYIENSTVKSAVFILSSSIYLGLIIGWTYHIYMRIISKKRLTLLLSMSGLLLLYIILRNIKYAFVLDYYDMGRYFWYAYYIPQMIVPVLSLIAAYDVGKPSDSPFDKRWIAPIAMSFVLIGLIMTNDFHNLAFTFDYGIENWSRGHSYGPLFVVTTAWIYLWLFGSVGILFYKCSISDVKKYTWVPALFVLCGTIYILMMYYLPDSIDMPFNLPEMHCFIIIAMWDSYIKIGLVPSNLNYDKYIKNSTFPLTLTDKALNVVFSSNSVQPISYEQMTQAVKEPVEIGMDTLLHAYNIRGGYMFWTEDTTAVNNLQYELKEIGEGLTEKGEMLRRDNELKEQLAAVEVQNRIYDDIAVKIKPQLQKLSQIVNSRHGFEENIAYVCVLNSFIKRMANLTLLANYAENININELFLSISESSEYLRLLSVTSAVSVFGSGEFKSEDILAAFELREYIIESCIDTLKTEFVSLTADENGFYIKMNIDADNISQLKDQLPKIAQVSYEDETCYVSAYFSKGGDKA